SGVVGEVVAVPVAAVLDDDVGDPHVPNGPLGVAEDADAVAGQVAEVHVADADVLRPAREVNAADADSYGPGVAAADDLSAQELDVTDIGPGESMAGLGAIGIETKDGPVQPQGRARAKL